MSKEQYLQTDDLKEALRDLEMVGEFLEKVDSQIYYWKWVIFALHGSLQGFMVAALKGSDGLNVLTEKSKNEWLKAHEAGSRTYPPQKLDSFPNLYKKIKTELMVRYHGSQKFIATNEQDWSVQKLNSIRNDYIHFQPKLWLIPKEGLPQIAKECLSVIKFLALDSGNVRYRKGFLATKVERLIEQIDSVLDKLVIQYRPDI